MDLIVCLKRVPDTTARLKVGADGKSISPEGVDFVVNPYDEFAIEAALQLKDKHGGETVGVTLDADGSDAILRKALAMGLDRGVVIKGGNPFDGAATAEILAGVIKGMKYDLILFGKQAIDGDAYQVPSMVAHHLGIPRVNVVTKLEVDGGVAKCRRQIEGAEEIVELKLPAVVACQKGLNEPRYPSLKGIMAAKKKPVDVKAAPAVAARLEVLKLETPAARPAGRIVGQGKDAVPELIRLLREEAKVI